VNQPLSSDHNHPGDTFTATLVQPLVADGVVIARRGQTVAGRVAEARKAGRAKGTSRLGIEITEVSLVDGQQLPVKAQLMERRGDTSVGRDVGAIGVTTGAGAAIGAGVAGPFGAGVGALAGAFVSTIGRCVSGNGADVPSGRPTHCFDRTFQGFSTRSPGGLRAAGIVPAQPAAFAPSAAILRRLLLPALLLGSEFRRLSPRLLSPLVSNITPRVSIVASKSGVDA
jgi:hypothetical protein